MLFLISPGINFKNVRFQSGYKSEKSCSGQLWVKIICFKSSSGRDLKKISGCVLVRLKILWVQFLRTISRSGLVQSCYIFGGPCRALLGTLWCKLNGTYIWLVWHQSVPAHKQASVPAYQPRRPPETSTPLNVITNAGAKACTAYNKDGCDLQEQHLKDLFYCSPQTDSSV